MEEDPTDGSDKKGHVILELTAVAELQSATSGKVSKIQKMELLIAMSSHDQIV